MNLKPRLTSIENASLIRKFTVLFIVMSLLPFLVIAFLLTQYNTQGAIALNQNNLIILIFLTGFGALAGFWGMRRSIIKIQEVAKYAKDALPKDAPVLEKIKSEENEITQLAKAFNEVTKNLEDNIKRLESSKRTMQYVLSKIASGVSSSLTIDTFLDLIVEIVVQALEAKKGVLMLLDDNKGELYAKVIAGLGIAPKDLRIKIGEEGPGWVAKNKKPLLIPQLHKKDGREAQEELFAPPLLCAPLIYQDKVVGVLAVIGKASGGSFSEDELLIVSNLASQTAIAVENERLHKDAEKTYLETISALAIAVEARDSYSRGHLDRVSKYAVKTALALGVDEKAVKDIRAAAELHDLGKIGISDEILRKDGSLNPEEENIMRKHTIIGEGIIKPVTSLLDLCEIVRHHHERIDGAGYPDGIRGEEISLGAKILCVADSFDAMTTDRPYRKALSIDEAKGELRKCVGSYYDPKVVEAFLQVI